MGNYIKRAIILRHPAPKSIEYSLEVAESCEKYGLSYTFFDGYYTTDVKELNTLSGWTFPDAWVKEYCCTAGHFNIWKDMVSNWSDDDAVAVLEHDAIVKRRMDDIFVEDGEIAFLGLRVESRNDYTCPDLPIRKWSIPKFEGTHGYALTSTTARRCLLNIKKLAEIPCPIDGLMGIHNVIDQKFTLVDPCPMICEVGGRTSFTQFESAKYNIPHPPGFEEGLVKGKYKLDKELNRTLFNTDADLRFDNPKFKEELWNKLDSFKEEFNIPSDKFHYILDIYPQDGTSTYWLSGNLADYQHAQIVGFGDFESELHVKQMLENDIHSNIKIKDRFMYNTNLSKNRLKIFMYAGIASAHLNGLLINLPKNICDLIVVRIINDEEENNKIREIIKKFIKPDGFIVLYSEDKDFDIEEKNVLFRRERFIVLGSNKYEQQYIKT